MNNFKKQKKKTQQNQTSVFRLINAGKKYKKTYNLKTTCNAFRVIFVAYILKNQRLEHIKNLSMDTHFHFEQGN